MAHSQHVDSLAGAFLANSLVDANFTEFCERVEEMLYAHERGEIASTDALRRIGQALDMMREYNYRLWRQVAQLRGADHKGE